jgi:hypothetical protein
LDGRADGSPSIKKKKIALKMLSTILKDKEKIKETIEELD